MTMQTILRPVRGSALDVSVSTTHAVVGPFTRDNLGFYCPVACYIKLGEDNTVEATASSYDLYIPAGQIRDFSAGGATFMSVLGASAETAYINEWTARPL